MSGPYRTAAGAPPPLPRIRVQRYAAAMVALYYKGAVRVRYQRPFRCPIVHLRVPR